jgi:hypothetical protein
MNLTAYHLIAYEVGTDIEVLNWPNVVPIHRFNRGDLIGEGDAQWQVVGARNTSTEQLWQIDVKEIFRNHVTGWYCSPSSKSIHLRRMHEDRAHRLREIDFDVELL